MTEGGTKLKGPDSRLHRDTFLSPYQAKLWHGQSGPGNSGSVIPG